jgi:hypothetical protein
MYIMSLSLEHKKREEFNEKVNEYERILRLTGKNFVNETTITVEKSNTCLQNIERDLASVYTYKDPVKESEYQKKVRDITHPPSSGNSMYSRNDNTAQLLDLERRKIKDIQKTKSEEEKKGVLSKLHTYINELSELIGLIKVQHGVIEKKRKSILGSMRKRLFPTEYNTFISVAETLQTLQLQLEKQLDLLKRIQPIYTNTSSQTGGGQKSPANLAENVPIIAEENRANAVLRTATKYVDTRHKTSTI